MRRLVWMLLVVLPCALAACGGSGSSGSSGAPASPTPLPSPGTYAVLYAPALSSAVPTAGPIVLYQGQRSFGGGGTEVVLSLQVPQYTCITPPAQSPLIGCSTPALLAVTSYVSADPTIAAVATTDPLGGNSPPTAPPSTAYLSLKGYGATTVTALSGQVPITSTPVYTYRSVNLSCDIAAVQGVTFAADGSATTATSPATADVYFTAPVPGPGIGSCTNPAFNGATTSPLQFPSGATSVPIARLSDLASIHASAWRNDFTTLPALALPSAIVFRARSGATVKYTAPGLYEAAPAGADFPY